MNVPDRSDYYLAQVAYEVCRGNVKNPGSLKPDQFALKFRDPKRERAEGKYKRQSDHQLVLSKQVWMGRVANSGPRPGKKSSRGKDGSKKSAQGKKFKVEMPMPAKREDD